VIRLAEGDGHHLPQKGRQFVEELFHFPTSDFLLRGPFAARGIIAAMITAVPVDVQAIERACEAHGVRRLRIFGSVLSTNFDAEKSDVDFLVEFLPGRGGLFHDYFELKEELERILHRGVDLVDAGAVRNPYFARSAFGNAEELYAA
jgi:predicted nucleotidyltransferase